MLDERFVLLGVAFNIYGGLSYLISTVKGRTKPNRVTWFFWAVAPLLAFAAELSKGVGWQSLMTFMVGFSPLLIFIASFVNKKSYWRLNKFDYFYGSLSLLGIILWRITGEGNLAILLAILADGFAGLPTIVKAYYEPTTEDYKAYLFSMLSAIITLLTIDQWTFAHWGFPAYIFGICAVIFVLVRFKLGLRLRKIYA